MPGARAVSSGIRVFVMVTPGDQGSPLHFRNIPDIKYGRSRRSGHSCWIQYAERGAPRSESIILMIAGGNHTTINLLATGRAISLACQISTIRQARSSVGRLAKTAPPEGCGHFHLTMSRHRAVSTRIAITTAPCTRCPWGHPHIRRRSKQRSRSRWAG